MEVRSGHRKRNEEGKTQAIARPREAPPALHARPEPRARPISLALSPPILSLRRCSRLPSSPPLSPRLSISSPPASSLPPSPPAPPCTLVRSACHQRRHANPRTRSRGKGHEDVFRKLRTTFLTQIRNAVLENHFPWNSTLAMVRANFTFHALTVTNAIPPQDRQR